MPMLIVMVGLPGSGKSTVIESIRRLAFDSFVYSTDAYIEDVAKRKGKTYSEVFQSTIKQATGRMNKALLEAIGENRTIIWDQTNLTAKKRKSILNSFPARYVKECIVLMPPQNAEEEAELERRLGSRPGKNIPPKVMKRMLASFEMPTEAEGFEKVTQIHSLRND